jgi:hypothetical protein
VATILKDPVPQLVGVEGNRTTELRRGLLQMVTLAARALNVTSDRGETLVTIIRDTTAPDVKVGRMMGTRTWVTERGQEWL